MVSNQLFFVISTLLNFLVLKYQNQDESPFETHPKTVLFGIISLLMYCLCCDCRQRIHEPHRRSSSSPVIGLVLHSCILFFGYMAIACLASLLFPDSASPVVYTFYGLILVSDLLYLVYERIKMMRQRGGGYFQGRRLNSLVFLRNLTEFPGFPGHVIFFIFLRNLTEFPGFLVNIS